MVEIIRYEKGYELATKKLILGILAKEFGLGDEELEDLDDLQGFYQRGRGGFWIAVENGEIVGSVAIKDYGAGRGYLKRLYVATGYRGTGLAKKLLDTALHYAKEAGFREIFLGTVPEMAAANRFYSKNGFERISKLPGDLPEFGDTIFYRMVL